MAAEQRREARRRKRLKVRFGVETAKRMAFSGDLSVGGMFVITGQPERPGSKLLLEISLSESQNVVVLGQVRWAKKVPPNLVRVANKAGMGIRFIEFTSGHDAYKDYLQSFTAE